MTTELTTLGELLGNDNRYDPQHLLYLPMDEIWQPETRCAVLAQSDLDGVPDLARENGLSYALGIASVQE